MQAINEQEEIKRKTEEWTMELVGKVIVSEKIAEQVGANEVLESSLPKPYRILPPGSMATMDWRPDRMNVHTEPEKDGKYVVTRVTFG